MKWAVGQKLPKWSCIKVMAEVPERRHAKQKKRYLSSKSGCLTNAYKKWPVTHKFLNLSYMNWWQKYQEEDMQINGPEYSIVEHKRTAH